MWGSTKHSIRLFGSFAFNSICASPSWSKLLQDFPAKLREFWSFPAFLVSDLSFMPCWLGFTLFSRSCRKKPEVLPWTRSFWLQLIKVEELSLSLLEMAADGKSCSSPLPNDVAILYHNVPLTPLTPCLELGPRLGILLGICNFFLFRERWDNPGLACWVGWSNANNYIFHFSENMYLIDCRQCSWKHTPLTLIF